MSNQNDDLDPIDDLEPLDELKPVSEAEPAPPASEIMAQAPHDVDGEAAGSDGGKRKAGVGDKRELEQAPIELRKAAQILLYGSILPIYMGLSFATADASADFEWVGKAMFPWGIFFGAKILALLGGYIFHEGYKATHGGEEKGPIAKLAKTHNLAPMIMALVIWGVAIFVSTTGSVAALQGPKLNPEVWTTTILMAEVLTMILAMATISHIYGYEHGGKFNPVFPLMFMGPAIIGLVNLLSAGHVFGGDHVIVGALGLIGSLVIAAGGVMAMLIMKKAMREAKVEGERKANLIREKRKAEQEAKRAAREAAKSTQ